ncbi:uncharacterized protein LOC118406118 [Branchiostoma floridae]|uniref:Uncharacterized protein LOC118406118 n=1 Tax=Branchiostoma floridae TaxID=7739 RepID=A0A9J7KGH5_BRAFL|nr:uncharacterized protein LOC118406118 [Branchiostoma floridae]
MSKGGPKTGVPGGWGPWTAFDQVETDRARALLVLFRGEAEKTLNNGKAFEAFIPLSYQTQVVAGTNYSILAFVGDLGGSGQPKLPGPTVHFEVFWGLGPALPELTKVEWWVYEQAKK